MFRFYLKAALKIIKSYKAFTVLNIFGLTIGISSCLLIILYVNFELGFDKFHKNKDDIYRVVMHQPGNQVVGSSSEWWVVSPYILKPTWENEIPEIKTATRTRGQNRAFKLNGQYISENILIVDPEFFDVFTFPLRLGHKNEVLANPYSIVLSEKMAKKYFGEENPIGKTLEDKDGVAYQVTGITENVPENSHLKFDFLISFQTLESLNGRSLISENWLNNSYDTYLVLNKNTNLKELDKKLRKYDVEGFNDKMWSFHLQPLTDIHFNRQISGTGNKGTLFIFISVGIFILLIAGFNYMNLYIAHYRARTKNVGIERVSGATRTQLIFQFLTETFLLVLISFITSIIVVALVLPFFNDFVGEQLLFSSLWNYKIIGISFCVVFFMALISGTYPAIYLSGLQIISGIKGGMKKFSKSALALRKSIIVAQFSVSIVLLIGTITVFRQLNYTANKNLGFEKDLILYMSLRGIWYQDENGEWKDRTATLQNELLKNPNIMKTAGSSGVPTKIGWSNIPVWEGQIEGDNPFIYRLAVDENFLDLYGIRIKEGRNFSADLKGEAGNAYILNEAAVKRMEFKNPVGSRFGFDNKLGTVVGVVNDFHFESLHNPITPLGIGLSNNNINYLSVKISNNNVRATIGYIEDTWKNLTKTTLNFSFIDDQLNYLYRKDKQLAESMNYFSLMALFISCLGIFGIISFSLKERTKELGIRKVLGAEFTHLLKILSKDIFAIIGVASVVGGIGGWYFAGRWLNNFAYRINMSIDTVVFSSLITFLIVTIPLLFKLLGAIKSNPVEALRNE